MCLLLLKYQGQYGGGSGLWQTFRPSQHAGSIKHHHHSHHHQDSYNSYRPHYGGSYGSDNYGYNSLYGSGNSYNGISLNYLIIFTST